MTIQKTPTRILHLQDARMLEYAEFGDPVGTPVFYFHGFCGSCYQACLAHEFALKQGIRLIAPNRPGIGRSSPSHMRCLTEYAKDIAELADALAITSFAIVGASGGGSFALACTYALPDRAFLVGVAGCVGPLDVMQNLDEMSWCRRTFLSGCHKYPRFSAALLNVIFATCKRRPMMLYQWLSWVAYSRSATPDHRDMIEQVAWWDYQNVFLQSNGAHGLLREAYLYFHWGFHMRDFPRTSRALFWHSRDDTVIPYSITQRMTSDVKHSSTIFCTGGHLMFLMKVQDLMAMLKRELSAIRLQSSVLS